MFSNGITQSSTYRQIHTQRHTDKHMHREMDRQTESKWHRQTDTARGLRHVQTRSHAVYTHRQTDRQTDRQTASETHTDRLKLKLTRPQGDELKDQGHEPHKPPAQNVTNYR